MTMEIKGSVSGVVATGGCMKLADHLPQISLEDVHAVIKRSRSAARLKAEFDERVAHRGIFSRDEVKDLLERAGGTGKKADPDHAVVLAYYAQNHAEVFAPDAHPLVAKFLGDVDWSTLMADLKSFIQQLQEREAEAKRAEQLKKELLTDDVKRDDRKRDLVKQNGTAADRKKDLQQREAEKAGEKERLREASPAQLEDELTGSGRLELSEVERTRLALMKKGFANRE